MTDAPESAASAPADRSAEAAAVLRELLRLADVPATLDVKDAADGGISIAMALGVEVPGVVVGRRGTFVDALQFLVNKLTHRPGRERRWVSLGVGEHPPPRGPRPPAPRVPVDATATGGPGAPPRPAPKDAVTVAAPPPAPPRASASEEVEASEDPELTLAARALAQASATAGRLYGVVALTAADGVRMVRAVAGVPGVSAAVEGEGRLRRLVLTPDRPTPMPKKAHPMGVDVDEAGVADEPGR